MSCYACRVPRSVIAIPFASLPGTTAARRHESMKRNIKDPFAWILQQRLYEADEVSAEFLDVFTIEFVGREINSTVDFIITLKQHNGRLVVDTKPPQHRIIEGQAGDAE